MTTSTPDDNHIAATQEPGSAYLVRITKSTARSENSTRTGNIYASDDDAQIWYKGGQLGKDLVWSQVSREFGDVPSIQPVDHDPATPHSVAEWACQCMMCNTSDNDIFDGCVNRFLLAVTRICAERLCTHPTASTAVLCSGCSSEILQLVELIGGTNLAMSSNIDQLLWAFSLTADGGNVLAPEPVDLVAVRSTLAQYNLDQDDKAAIGIPAVSAARTRRRKGSFGRSCVRSPTNAAFTLSLSPNR